jgi:hypothetical protein
MNIYDQIICFKLAFLSLTVLKSDAVETHVSYSTSICLRYKPLRSCKIKYTAYVT